jgi:uncharacterized OsmC-like protein
MKFDDNKTEMEIKQPIPSFLAALAGCELSVAQYIAKNMKIKIEKVEFDIKAERDERGVFS